MRRPPSINRSTRAKAYMNQHPLATAGKPNVPDEVRHDEPRERGAAGVVSRALVCSRPAPPDGRIDEPVADAQQYCAYRMKSWLVRHDEYGRGAEHHDRQQKPGRDSVI